MNCGKENLRDGIIRPQAVLILDVSVAQRLVSEQTSFLKFFACEGNSLFISNVSVSPFFRARWSLYISFTP